MSERILYTVPSRLIGERRRIHIYDSRLDCYLGSTLTITLPRAFVSNHNHRGRQVDYRHVITSNILFGRPLVGWSSVMTAILLLSGGQIVMLGIIGEYLWLTLDESRNRPAYFIEKDSHSIELHISC